MHNTHLTLTRKLNNSRKYITICTRRFYGFTYQNIIYNMCTCTVCIYIGTYIGVYDRLAEMGVSARWIIAPVNCFGSTYT